MRMQTNAINSDGCHRWNDAKLLWSVVVDWSLLALSVPTVCANQGSGEMLLELTS
jgi:hypothetical protein